MSSTASAAPSFSVPAPLVALIGWIIPGAGYFFIGQRVRGAVIGVTVILMFVFGVLLAGIRVIDVPGYDRGEPVYYQMQVDSHGDVSETKTNHPGMNQPAGRWAMIAHPFVEITNKPWFVPQVITGPLCLAAAAWSNSAARPAADGSVVEASHARIYEIGTLYTAIAGMLNLLAIIDASSRASGGH
jgi:hypothetical protein